MSNKLFPGGRLPYCRSGRSQISGEVQGVGTGPRGNWGWGMCSGAGKGGGSCSRFQKRQSVSTGSLEADLCLFSPKDWAWGPVGTHVGVARAMPPSLSQAILAPDGWPGKGGSTGERWGRGSRGRPSSSPCRRSCRLTWGCRSDGWRRTRRRRTSGYSHPTGSTGPRPHPLPPVVTRRGRTPACSTTAGRMGGVG